MTVNSCGTTNVRSLNPSTNFDRDLDIWVESQNNQVDALEAKSRILEFLYCNETQLDLSSLSITSLPEGFNPSDLEEFELNCQFLESLPEEFNPPKLKHLDLDGATAFSRLPENFNPPQLEILTLDGTRINTLPEAFNPPQLKVLNLNKKSILERLGLRPSPYFTGVLGIASLPENFNPPLLESLGLSGARIERLPEGFNPSQLKELDLSYTRIASLPENFNPPQLEKLNLISTEMTSLPETLFNLPRSCTIYLNLSNFSSRVRENLQERVSRESYQGPRFEFSMGNLSPETLESYDSLEEAFKVIFEKSRLNNDDEGLIEKLIQNQSQLETENLRRWLNRLFETASAASDRNEVFFKEVVSILQEAAANEEYRNNIFYRVLDDANTTCGDRISLSVMHLGIQKDLQELDISHPKDVADFLVNGVMTLDLLENYATDVIPTLPLTDPLEVYLGLPLHFKQEFNIPIKTENMLYFTCSGLQKCHIDAAREKLKTALDDEDKVLSFLIEQPKWLECLKKARPEKMRELEKVKDRRLEEESFEKAAEILEDYSQGLKELTKAVRRIARFSLRIRA